MQPPIELESYLTDSRRKIINYFFKLSSTIDGFTNIDHCRVIVEMAVFHKKVECFTGNSFHNIKVVK